MKFFNRFLKKTVAPSTSRLEISGLSVSVTAHEAWSVAAPAARALDPGAKLTLITSGLDLNHQGRSREWSFIFYLPDRDTRVMLSIEPDPQSEDVDASSCILTRRVSRAFSTDADRAFFPERFRDSPEVVAEFSANGVDFMSGPTDMKLEGRILPSGEAVWVTYDRDREYRAPFTSIGD